MSEFITPVQLSKLTGQRPQAVYNLIKQGYIKADQKVCEGCGTTKWLIEESVGHKYAESYLKRKELKNS